MLLNSIPFLLFFLAVIIPYYALLSRSRKAQNVWLLLASYVFYGMADWRMLPLLAATTLAFYGLGWQIARAEATNPMRASRLTTLGVVIGILVLFGFKYLGFCVEQFTALLARMGLHVQVLTLRIVMPLGISYFLFKLMSYLIEIHRQHIRPETDLVAFSAYVAFFPTIIAGPIDRPNQFLPQLGQVRRADADMLSEGCRTFLWGLFMKLCISDRLVVYTTAVLDNAQAHNSTSIIVAILMYALQIYTDFAGYSNMAIGVGLLLGLKVTPNFNRPFLATSVAAFWRRWHISLTTWITDYIFMPLNLRWRDRGAMGLYMATMVNLLVIGAWHGANWTYVVFGAFYGVVMVVEMSLSQRRKKFEKSHHLKSNALYRTLRWMEVFLIYAFAAMIFRAADMGDVCTVVSQIFTCPGSLYIGDWLVFVYGGCSVVLLLFKEVKDELGWNVHLLHAPNRWVRIVSFALLLCYVIGTGVLDGVNFIYMQF